MPVGQAATTDDDLSFRLSGAWLGTATQHDALEVVIGQGPRMVVHDQSLTLHDLRLDVAWRVTPRFSAWAAVGSRWIDNRIVYRDASGAAVTILNPSVHHRNETVTGLTDAELGAEVSWRWRGLTVRPRVGLTLPLGNTVDDPFALGDAGLPHQHVQTGTGTVDLLAALNVAVPWHGWQIAGGLWTRQIMYANGHGYQGGDRYTATVSLGHALPHALTLRASAEVSHEAAETWHGMRYTDDGNLGRTDVLVGAAIEARLAPQLSVDASVKVPVYVDVVGGQITYPAIVSVGLTFAPTARAARPKHEHHHDHGDHDDDHDDDATATAAPPLENVVRLDPRVYDLQLAPKGLTVVDFSATWCKPCHELTPQVVALLARVPTASLRFADVSDGDSVLARTQFGKQTYVLPLVMVFDATGRVVATLRGSPSEIMQALTALLLH